MRETPSIASTTPPAHVRSPTNNLGTQPSQRIRSIVVGADHGPHRFTAVEQQFNDLTTNTADPSACAGDQVHGVTLPSTTSTSRSNHCGPGGRPVLAHLEVLRIGHHVEKRCRRRVLDDQDRIPPPPLSLADVLDAPADSDPSARVDANADVGSRRCGRIKSVVPTQTADRRTRYAHAGSTYRAADGWPVRSADRRTSAPQRTEHLPRMWRRSTATSSLHSVCWTSEWQFCRYASLARETGTTRVEM